MVNKPLIRPYFWGGSFGGAARIPLITAPEVGKFWDVFGKMVGSLGMFLARG